MARWLLPLALIGATPGVRAIDRIELDVARLASAPYVAIDAHAMLELPAEGPPRLTVRAARLEGVDAIGALEDLRLTCREVVAREGRFACDSGAFAARGGPLGSLDFRARAAYHAETEALTFAGSGQAVAGGELAFEGRLRGSRWALDAQLRALQLPRVRELLAPWIELPDALTADARIAGHVRASGAEGAVPIVFADLETSDLDFTNEDGTLVAEQVAARLAATVRLRDDGPAFEGQLSGSAGQALAGPVLLDFAANPLRLELAGEWRGGTLAVREAGLALANLIEAAGEARITLQPEFAIADARIAIEALRFPAAYRSFLQLPLATTDFGALDTSGVASGTLTIEGGELTRLDAQVEDLDVEDTRGKFSMHDVHGELHWAAGSSDVAASHLRWSRGSAYGLSGGAARIDFRTHARSFELTQAARLPIFDGALRVRALAVRELGKREAELDFEAVLEPISMPMLSRAFGWPELSGDLSGSIPGVTYRNGVLAVQGDLQAQVFDGSVTARSLRLQDPLGPWPRLFADLTARSLDLELVTRTFSIGTITGRLNADIERLELFNWSPIAFEARLYTPPGDRSPHRISQKAVTSISSIGSGGGGGVAKTLQSGVLRFFDDFNYDRVGITCRLRNEVCLMSGIPREGQGYYIVKGRGLPRIDIIGINGRVNWPRLVRQIVAGMQADDVVVR